MLRRLCALGIDVQSVVCGACDAPDRVYLCSDCHVLVCRCLLARYSQCHSCARQQQDVFMPVKWLCVVLGVTWLWSRVAPC